MILRRPQILAALAALVVGLALSPAASAGADRPDKGGGKDKSVRVATFNASLNRFSAGELEQDLSTGDDEQARNVAEIIQRTDPDVLLLNEFDYTVGRESVDLFRDNYLEVGQGGAAPVDYPYAYTAPVNTGVPSGFDLNNDGAVGGPDDAYGFGFFPGQYGMVVYSKYPIDTDAVRTFQMFRWTDMPGNLIPPDFYSPQEVEALRLSSKSHWDVPVQVGDKRLHFLVSHPTPPVFDGPEDRNGRRNNDEIRFWADYISPGQRSAYIYDDGGATGGLEPGARFVIAGDQNSDPFDGDSVKGSIEALLDHSRVNTKDTPRSAGAVEAAILQGGSNAEHQGNPAYDTADFAEPPGNIRVDYVLPSKSLRILAAAVFWPTSDDPLSRLTGTFPFPSSDHRLVYVDLQLPHRG